MSLKDSLYFVKTCATQENYRRRVGTWLEKSKILSMIVLLLHTIVGILVSWGTTCFDSANICYYSLCKDFIMAT